jgi:hypothetical protein
VRRLNEANPALPRFGRNIATLGDECRCIALGEAAMNRWLRWSMPVVVLLAVSAPVAAADLALKRVVLSSGGVGYFEYEAAVEGDAALTLDVPLDQVDDVLKSLMVYDQAGSAGEITLPGREPLTQSFSDLPFDRDALSSAAALLNALQGAEIRLSGDKTLTGRLVHADDDTVRNADGTTQTRSRISVMTDTGLRQFVLQDFAEIGFLDPDLQTKIKTALARIAEYHAQGRRRLTLTIHGGGKRQVRVGYVVAMPLWKASYRVLLPSDAQAGTARLQGWAVLENFSGQAWNDVDLTLLSGNPVTFRQALYESYYVPRQTVPVEAGNRVLPPPDTGAVAGVVSERAAMDDPARMQPQAKAMRAFPAGAAAAMPPLPAPAPPPPPPPASIEAAAAAEEAAQIAFTPPYKITVAAGQSLVLPLIDRELPTRRVDLYQPYTDAAHPLAAIELTNGGETGLPPGVLTLYQQADKGTTYLGDARLAALPAGDKRLLSYAVDNKVTIDRAVNDHQSIVKATIADGLMRLTRLNRQTTTYAVKASGTAPTVIVEHPRLAGWNLTTPDPGKVERTATAYRIPASVGADGKATLTVSEDRPVEESLRLTDLDDDRVGVFVAAKELDPQLRQALADLAQRRKTVGQRKADLDRLNGQRGQLVEDETRLRDNYTAVKDDPGMRKRALGQLNETETALDANASAIAKATSALAAAEADLASYVAALKM